VECAADVDAQRLVHGEVEVHGGGTVDDVGHLVPDALGDQRVEAAARLLHVAGHRYDHAVEVGRVPREAGRIRHFLGVALLRLLGAARPDQQVDAANADLRALAQQLFEHDLANEARGARQEDGAALLKRAVDHLV